MRPVLEKKIEVVKFNPFIFSNHVGDRMDQEPIRRPPLQQLTENVEGIQDFVKKERQDWIFIITGVEGTGKSTLGLQLARILDPKFDLDSQMVYSLRDEYSYIDYLDKYRHVPFKAVVFDEAVTALFSRDHSSSVVKDAIKIFNMNRDLQHFYVLIAPSFWGLDIDIRERRGRTLLYVFMDTNTFKRKYAWFDRRKMITLSSSDYARKAFPSPGVLFSVVSPNFVESFGKLTKEEEHVYHKKKAEHFDETIREQKEKSKKSKKSKGGNKK